MKNRCNSILPALLLLSLCSAVSAADQPMQMKQHQMMKGRGMMGNMSEEQREQHMRSMQEHMLNMHDLSNRILSEQDPQKKQQLKDQQLELMKAHHQKMRSMRQGQPKPEKSPAASK